MPASFATLLRSHRLAARLSQEELAEAARISSAAVGAYERGVRLTPHKVTLVRLADALRLAETNRARFLTAARRKLANPRLQHEAAVVGLWRTLLGVQSDEQLNATADAAIELLRAIDDTAQLATCWTLLAERLERAGQTARSRAPRNCAQALEAEDRLAYMMSA